jgi:MFS transporter, UMF1 family
LSITQVIAKPRKGAVVGWMLFDWAAQPFFTVVITFIFGPYFVARFVSDPVVGQAAWGYTITISGIIIAFFSPVLGAIADASGSRKKWIGFFAVIQIISLSLLWYAAPGSALWLPMLLIILATIAAEFSIVFNDSMMPTLVDKTDVGRISNLAWGLGYLGGLIVLFAVLLLLSANPNSGRTLIGLTPLFGLDQALGEDARITGPLSALWYFVFIIPLFLLTPDSSKGLSLRESIGTGLRELKNTLVELQHRKSILRFLVARMIYQDGVSGLLALGGTFAAGMFAWQTVEMGIYGILLLILAIGGCYFAGKLDSRIGSKKVVVASLLCLIFATLGIVSTGPGYTLFGLLPLSTTDSGGLFGTSAEKIYILFGMLVGLVFGPAQASSRSYLARSVSVEEAGRFFGLYALSGRATSFLAPMSVATLTLVADSARFGMSALIVFLILGFLLLLKTPYPASDLALPRA